MQYGFVKTAALTPSIRVADCAYNARQIIEVLRGAAAAGAEIACLPELCITGYTCGDLFFQPVLQQGARDALADVLRDTAEPLLLRAFLAADKPVLAICRGIQLMNVALGGDLYQDIKPFEHVPHNDHWGKIHTVTVRRDTLLSRILGQDTVLVNSQHHQAVDKVAPGLVLSALSEDGIVEGIEKPGAKFCLGVQWHPEWLSAADSAMQGIFDAFVAACR